MTRPQNRRRAFDDFVDRASRKLKVLALDIGVAVAQYAGFDSRKPLTPEQYQRPLDAQGNFRLDIDTRPKTLASPDLGAFATLRDREKIFALTRQELDLTGQLSEAKKALADATAQNDLVGVKVALGDIQRLEAQKKGAEAAKKSAEEWKRALESVEQLERRVLGSASPRAKIEQDRVAALAKDGLSPALRGRISDAYASLDFDADLKVASEAKKLSQKAFEDSDKFFMDAGKRSADFYTQAFADAIKTTDSILKSEIEAISRTLAQADDFKRDSLSRRAAAASSASNSRPGPPARWERLSTTPGSASSWPNRSWTGDRRGGAPRHRGRAPARSRESPVRVPQGDGRRKHRRRDEVARASPALERAISRVRWPRLRCAPERRYRRTAHAHHRHGRRARARSLPEPLRPTAADRRRNARTPGRGLRPALLAAARHARGSAERGDRQGARAGQE
jgi:hypothetical protein